MSHIETHRNRVEAWGRERGLYETDSPMVQFGKMIEEVGELIMSIGKNDIEGIKDAIGDIRVCLIGVCAIAEVEFDQCFVATGHEGFGIADTSVMMGGIGRAIDRQSLSDFGSPDLVLIKQLIQDCIVHINLILSFWCNFHNLTLEECDNHAWSQIKDRKGKTVAGEFIKEQA